MACGVTQLHAEPPHALIRLQPGLVGEKRPEHVGRHRLAAHLVGEALEILEEALVAVLAPALLVDVGLRRLPPEDRIETKRRVGEFIGEISKPC